MTIIGAFLTAMVVAREWERGTLEALFVTRGAGAGSLLAGLEYVVVDELHAFLGTERGAQLRSLMHRVELSLRHRVPRVGLSATLGDMSLAAEALRPSPTPSTA